MTQALQGMLSRTEPVALHLKFSTLPLDHRVSFHMAEELNRPAHGKVSKYCTKLIEEARLQ